jgi:uncharacterized repeat protein (TIGR03803 family)
MAAASGQAMAYTLKTIAAFTGPNGATPVAGPVIDKGGNIYGTTFGGGSAGAGTAFMVTPPATGKTGWTLKTLVSFNGTNGSNPNAGLVLDNAGNLYGATSAGGTSGNGTIFRLTPPAAGKTAWTFATLVNFNGTNGSSPMASLISDSAGNLYGTTKAGGSKNYGTIYRLSPTSPGAKTWNLTTLASFTGYSSGSAPESSLVFGNNGILYGTTSGDSTGWGVLFSLSPPAAGTSTWKLSTLLSLNYYGEIPIGGPVIDSAGNLYGTSYGADNNVFRLSPPAAGKTAWTLTSLVTFNGKNGNLPYAGLTLDTAGNLYGVTDLGGTTSFTSNLGVAFMLSPPVAGKTTWPLKVIAYFRGTGGNGAQPRGRLAFDSSGNLYGTTSNDAGKASGAGSVFMITP